MVHRIFSMALCLVFAFNCFVVPSSAHGVGLETNLIDVTGFADWLFDKGYSVGSFLQAPFNHDICPFDPSAGKTHDFAKQHTTVNGKLGYYYICQYCGISAGEAYEQSYDAQVSALPSPSYNSNGELRWRLNVARIEEASGNGWGTIASSRAGSDYFVSLDSSECPDHGMVTGLFSEFIIPVTGNYTLYYYAKGENTYYLDKFTSITGEGNQFIYSPGQYDDIGKLSLCSRWLLFNDKGYSVQCDLGANAAFSAGDVLVHEGDYFYICRKKAESLASAYGYWELTCVPVTAPSGDTYNVTSRPTSITGDYGIIGDNGQITKVEGNTIVNETNNTYYNPATGKTDTISDWSYNYEDRSYTLTLGGGTTSTVTYGDENVTIKEGDTTYNVYYLVEGAGTPAPGPDTPCEHTWTETSTTPATCTVPGSRLLTCSLCNQTKTEAIPALGHDWQIKQTVATQYDDTGQLVQQGYTIFECSVCHEQYKSEDGTVPPGGADPPEEGGGLLDSLAQKITGTLESVLETVFSIFDSVPSLFDGFLAFLSAMFPYLPPEIITLLTFGIAAVVFIGIIKAIRR